MIHRMCWLIAAATLIVGGCGPGPKHPAEHLLGFQLDETKKQVIVTVISTGCTTRNDFLFEVADDALTLFRKKRDECKAMPEPIVLTWSFEELKLDPNKPYVVRNEFIANPNLAIKNK